MQYKLLNAMIVMAAVLTTNANAELKTDIAHTVVALKSATERPIPASFTPIETVTKNSISDMIIPYQKYRHANGLTVILHQDNSDPIAKVELSYRVGAANEPEGRKGLAHFFEHMMFEGTKHHPKGLFTKMIETTGGSSNAYTTSDITKYHERAPSNHLERLLWLESDRMGFFLDTLDEDLVEAQRKVIRNERLQNVDQNPYRKMSELSDLAFYPVGHPYHTPVLGFHEDIDNIRIEELRQFYLKYYSPNNAVLVIGGDIDTVQTLQWVDQYFGDIPGAESVSHLKPTGHTLKADRYISLREDVQTPLMLYRYTLPYDKQVNLAMIYLSSIIATGKESLFYKRLIETNIATDAGLSPSCALLACDLTFWIAPKTQSGSTLANAHKALQDTLKEYEKTGISEAEVQRVKDQLRAAKIFGLQSVDSKVAILSDYELEYGNPKVLNEEWQHALAISKEDIMAAYNRYIKDQPKLITTLLPNGDTTIKPLFTDNWERPHRTVKKVVQVSNSEMRSTPETFDRTVQPVSPPTPALSFPKVWQGKLDNGIKVFGVRLTESPITAVSLNIRAGTLNEPKDNMASMTATMLNQGTTKHSAEELSVWSKRLGSSVSIGSGSRTSYLNLNAISDNLDETLQIAEEVLFNPAFPKSDFDRIQSSMLQSIKEDVEDETTIAYNVLYETLYPDNNNTIDERLPALSDVTLEDTKDFYKSAYSANGAIINVVSNLDKETILDKLKIFDKLENKPIEDYKVTDGARINKHIYFVDKPDAEQSVILLGKHALKWDATGEYFKNKLMNYPLGSAFTSRINQKLREEKGYTYGAGSGFKGGHLNGEFIASLTAKTQHTADAIHDLVQVLEQYHEEGITDDELADLKTSFGQGDVMAYETPSDKLGYLFNIGFDELPENYNQQQHDIIASITKDEINYQANKWLGLEDAVIVVVGDKTQIGDKVVATAKQIKFDYSEVDYNGDSVE